MNCGKKKILQFSHNFDETFWSTSNDYCSKDVKIRSKDVEHTDINEYTSHVWAYLEADKIAGRRWNQSGDNLINIIQSGTKWASVHFEKIENKKDL